MREILFKAKRIDNEEWVEGSYLYCKKATTVSFRNEHYILVFDGYGVAYHEIDKDTICQYTGLTDKNGNKIWENDIVFVTDGDGCSGSSDTGVGEIDFLMGLWYISGSIQNGLYDVLEVIGHEAEVIGNTFDNADLLKGE